MSFQNYNLKNNAKSTFAATCSAGATSLTAQTGTGGLFPTANFLITCENFDPTTGAVLKREIIKVTSRTGDTFNITGGRGAGTCPPSDASTTPGTTAQSFAIGDTIRQYYTAEQSDDVQVELARLETAKLDISSYQKGEKVYAASSGGTDAYAITLSPAITGYLDSMVFKFQADVGNTGAATLNVNGLGAIAIKKQHDVDLATGDIEAGQIVTVVKNGAKFQMDSQLASIPTIDITGQTENTLINEDDYYIIYGALASANRKIKHSNVFPDFGDGSDGDVTITTDLSASPLTRDYYYNNLAITGSGILNPAGYRIFIKGTLTGNGKIQRNGSSNQTILGQGSTFAEVEPGASNTIGVSANPSYTTINGAAGGNGGSSFGGAAGAAGKAGGISVRGTAYNYAVTIAKALQYFTNPASRYSSGSIPYLGPSTAGGGGNGAEQFPDGPKPGGKGGCNGGFIFVKANTFNWTGTFEAIGGVGGAGTNSVGTASGGGGGGGGGNGGVVYLIGKTFTSIGSSTLTAGAGGAGGTYIGGGGGSAGAAGATGNAGVTIQITI